ncbi:PE-PGRS family protein [Streptomyces sp. NPDC003327]
MDEAGQRDPDGTAAEAVASPASDVPLGDGPGDRAPAGEPPGPAPHPLAAYVPGWERIAFNRALPDELLIRLLPRNPGLLFRTDLPPAVVDAAVAHPDRNVRAVLCEARVALTPAQWDRHLAAEPTAVRRALFVEDAAHARVALPPEALARLAADPAPAVRAEAARLAGLPAGLLRTLAVDPVPAVRAAVCGPAWPHLDPAAREALLADPEERVAAAALTARHREDPLGEEGLATLGGDGFRGLAECRLAPAVALRLAAHEDPDVRHRVAGHPDLPPAGVTRLAEDPDDGVREAVALRPDLTEEERAAVVAGIHLDTESRWPYALPWVAALHDDPDAMRRLAASPHPYVRGSVARARRLPPDAVALLARDEHRAVRLFLAESCDDAPPELLLEVWGWWTGSLSFPGRPRTHPRFPRDGLLRFAADPDPRLRRLALDDPAATPELVEEFSRDPSEEVRQDAARDPRLRPETVRRLLDDPDRSVRAFAARHPALPRGVLLRLLGDGTTAEDAVLNPALPAPVTRRIVDLLDTPVTALRRSANGG